MSFKIGDYVKIIPNTEYSQTTGGQTGYICDVGSEPNSFKINFDPHCQGSTCSKESWDLYSKDWSIRTKFLLLITKSSYEPINPIHKRIKDLWNKSNWVKANPTRAY